MTAPDGFVYLASASPRRRQLLAQIGVRFATVATEVVEDRLPGEPPPALVTRLALAKAQDALRRASDGAAPVLAADTAVAIAGEIFGKPAGEGDALRMLRRLSGITHEVFSAVAVTNGRREATALSRSEVTFRALSDAEIRAYWRTGEAADKAGAYGIQGVGAVFVSDLRGSYSGVMGLPLFETARLLRSFGVEVLPAAEVSP